MHQYVLTKLNLIEYADIYLKKQSVENARNLNVSNADHNKITVQITEQLSRKKRIQNTVIFPQTLFKLHFQWKIEPKR